MGCHAGDRRVGLVLMMVICTGFVLRFPWASFVLDSYDGKTKTPIYNSSDN